MEDSGEGPGGPGAPLIFRSKWGPKGPKTVFWGRPPVITGSGSATGLLAFKISYVIEIHIPSCTHSLIDCEFSHLSCPCAPHRKGLRGAKGDSCIYRPTLSKCLIKHFRSVAGLLEWTVSHPKQLLGLLPLLGDIQGIDEIAEMFLKVCDTNNETKQNGLSD